MAGGATDSFAPSLMLRSALRARALRTVSLAALSIAALVSTAGAQVRDTTARRDSAGAAAPAPAAAPARPKAWYEKISLRGYAQFRYNRLLESNEKLVCPQCDRSIGHNNNFFLRRARLVFSGNVHDRVSIYIQPDYATDAAGQQHYLQIRDAYFDVYLDPSRTNRLRFGQSKIPFGFENLQSSSQRLALDRDDALNSGLPNERDLGLLYYFSPKTARDRFRILSDSGLKGSGDYGVVGLGVYNGQTANRPEQNDNLHAVAHLAYPFRLANGQFVEVGAHGYHGRFVIPASQRSTGVRGPLEHLDERAAATLVVYPQPFGLQAEWNVGRGPEFQPSDSSIRVRRLEGGYVQAMFRGRVAGQQVIPFVRVQRYRGGKKLETDARRHDVEEVEGGVEWLPIPAMELTATFVQSDRLAEDRTSIGNRQKGHFLRLQAQFNY